MKEIVYNKLVRNRIPQIIEESGKRCETEILSNERYLEMLDKKLDEELAEYQIEKNIEERHFKIFKRCAKTKNLSVYYTRLRERERR